ncbi:hypothetical protein [Roseibium sp.]|uniref:hypothetical protein n=1 Tax=Roseibium sp. TaxID=1936156 RepID=UPI003A987A7A
MKKVVGDTRKRAPFPKSFHSQNGISEEQRYQHPNGASRAILRNDRHGRFLLEKFFLSLLSPPGSDAQYEKENLFLNRIPC